MNRFLILVFALAAFSCGKKDAGLKLPDLSEADRVEFVYKTDFDSTGKINLKKFSVSEKENIKAVVNTIMPGDFPYIYCLSTGSMSFYHNNELIINMVFNTTPDFRHIAYNVDNKVIAIPLSEDNARLLNSFKEKE